MKKWLTIITVAVVGVMLPQTGHAQGVGIGLKGGVNLANVGGEDVTDTDGKTGFSLGAFARFSTPGPLSIQPEVFFAQKGFSAAGFGGDFDWNTSYVEVPVLVRFGIGLPASPVKPVLFAGPAAGMLLSSKMEISADGTSVEQDVKDATKSIDFGAVFGAGIDFNRISVDLRYNLGLSSINDADDAGDVKNRAFSLSIGWLLPMGM